jgi:hypothetical protein
MKNIILLLAMIIGLSVCSAVAAASPSEVVRQFCQLDFDGARLSSVAYTTILPLIAYPEEPGWDTVIGIKGFKIEQESIFADLAEVVVIYEVDQSWPSGINTSSKETIKLVRERGAWKIKEYLAYPRVSSVLLCENYNLCN